MPVRGDGTHRFFGAFYHLKLLVVSAYCCRMFTRIADAAKALHVSERFLRQLITQNRIPFNRVSARTLRVDLEEQRDYMRLIAEEKPTPDDEGSSDD